MRFVKLGRFDKDFIKSARKRGPAGKHFGVFSPRYSENYILNQKLYSKMDTIKAILSKRAGEASPLPPSCVPVSAAEYVSICLNILENA